MRNLEDLRVHVAILVPHSRPAGGVKVLFRLGQGLTDSGIKCTMVVNKLSDRNLFWLGGPLSVPIIEVKEVSKYTLPDDITHLVHFGDGTSFGAFPDVKRILYLQGFGVHNYERECLNLLYPYDAVITVSKWLAEIASIQFRHEKVYVNYSGIDDIFKPMKIQKSEKVTTFGCLYHERESKNVNLFIAAMNKLSMRENVQAIFLSAKHPSQKFLDSMLFKYSFVINPSFYQIPLVYNSADIWVASSFSEGFGLSPVEAMACGVPSIIVESHGLDEFVKHRENCLVSKNDKTHLLSNMQNLISDCSVRKTLIDGGIKLASKFVWENSIKQFIEILREI